MKQAINAQYHPAPGGAFVDKILASQRRKVFDAFLQFKQGNANDTTLNVGMMPGPLFEKPDLLEAWCDQKERSRILSYQIEPPSAAASSPWLRRRSSRAGAPRSRFAPWRATATAACS